MRRVLHSVVDGHGVDGSESGCRINVLTVMRVHECVMEIGSLHHQSLKTLSLSSIVTSLIRAKVIGKRRQRIDSTRSSIVGRADVVQTTGAAIV